MKDVIILTSIAKISSFPRLQVIQEMSSTIRPIRRAAQLAAQVGVLEQDDLAAKNLLSRVSSQYEAEKQDRETAQARLDAEQVARAQAEARLEEECERMRSLEVILEAHKQQRDSDAAALQALELLLVQQKEQLKRLQEEREDLMSSQGTRSQSPLISHFT
jgi:chromosome segregation ATPase